MRYTAVIAALAFMAFLAIALRDPDAWVRVWAVIGLCVSVIASMVAVCAIDESKKRNG